MDWESFLEQLNELIEKLGELIKTIEANPIGALILLALVLSTAGPPTMVVMPHNHVASLVGTGEVRLQQIAV